MRRLDLRSEHGAILVLRQPVLPRLLHLAHKLRAGALAALQVLQSLQYLLAKAIRHLLQAPAVAERAQGAARV